MRLDELSLDSLMEDLPLLTVQKRLGLVLGAWVVLGFVSFFVFWNSALDQSSKLEGDIQQSLGQLELKSQLLLEAPAIDANLALLEAQLPVLKMALPTESELAFLLGRINELILKHELNLTEFTPETPIIEEVMRVVPVKLSVRGHGEAVSKLPNYIAALSRQVRLKEFEMSVRTESGDWQMTGQLNAFAQLPLNRPKPSLPEAEETPIQ